MAKKSKKVEKETRRLMEAVADCVKKKGDCYKFKSKDKKRVKKIKKKCVHWIVRKGKEVPTLHQDPMHPGMWKCDICGHIFPIKPVTIEEYENTTDVTSQYVDQMLFWSVKLGGDAEDTKMFLRLKEDLPRFKKVSKQILKHVNKRQAYEKNRERSDAMSQFDAYAGYNYNM